MKRIMLAFAFCGVALAHQARAVQYSKLGIVTAAKAAGKWEMVKAWINEAGYADEWQAAAYFSSDYPLFAAITNQVVTSGLATCAEVEAFLAAARDTAPDAMLSGVYARDMKTDSGRRRWHGDFKSHFETNVAERTIRRVDVFDDGYVHVEKGRERRYYTPEEMAERVANRQSKATLDDRIAALKVQIAGLEVKRSNGTNELEAAHATIQLAAKRKTLERLEASCTNEVTMVISP